MKIAARAGRGHLVTGSILVAGALGAALGAIALDRRALALLTFFLGVWGGVELGRCVERWMSPAALDGHRGGAA